MKQAILVTVYKDIDRLKILVDQFDDDFSFYIHIDKKSQIKKEDIELLENTENIRFISREYSINWGGFNHTKCILLLSKEALKDKEIEYIHLISGQDYPIKSCEEIKNLLEKKKGIEFLAYAELPNPKWPSTNGGLDRVDYYFLYDLFNRNSRVGGKIISAFLNIQKRLKLKRNKQYLPKLYGGWAWWSLSYPCLKYVVDYTEKNPLFFKRFEYTAIACEIYFHTIIMNSPFKKKVINNDLRYIVWSQGMPNPKVLDENDYDEIIKSDAIFARKIEYPASKKLIEKINLHILKSFDNNEKTFIPTNQQ